MHTNHIEFNILPTQKNQMSMYIYSLAVTTKQWQHFPLFLGTTSSLTIWGPWYHKVWCKPRVSIKVRVRARVFGWAWVVVHINIYATPLQLVWQWYNSMVVVDIDESRIKTRYYNHTRNTNPNCAMVQQWVIAILYGLIRNKSLKWVGVLRYHIAAYMHKHVIGVHSCNNRFRSL